MSQAFTISAVSGGEPKLWGHDRPGGPFADYLIKFTERGDEIITWSRKVGNVPRVGDSVTGNLTTNLYGTKFKQERPAGGGGSSKGDFRSKEQIIQQESDRTAAILCVAQAVAGKGFDFEEDFLKRSLALQERTSRLAADYGAASAAHDDGFKRKDITPTGQSDVPSDGFEPQQQLKTDDDIPF